MKYKMNTLVLLMLCALLVITANASADSLERLSAIVAPDGRARDCVAAGTFAYLAVGSDICIIDISDSTAPMLTYESNNTSMASFGIFIDDTLIYGMDAGDFWIGRIFPPDSIEFISFFNYVNPSYGPWGIEAVDSILYVANADEGLFIFNVKDPYNPFQITYYDTPGNLTEFFILDSLIYLADGDSVIILNISDPASPQHVGAVDIPRGNDDVHVVWPYAYCTSHTSIFGDGDDGSIEIVDVSNPSNPIIVGTIPDIRGTPRAIFVNEDYIYLAALDFWHSLRDSLWRRADVEGGIRVAQGIIPDSLIISQDTPANAREVYVRGDLVFVSDTDSLMIYQHHKTGIEEGELKNIPLISKFSLCPNPFRDKVTCYLQFQRATKINLSVYDKAGRTVREIYNGPVMSGKVRFYWDAKDQNGAIVPMGTYFIKISNERRPYSECRKVSYIGGIK